MVVYSSCKFNGESERCRFSGTHKAQGSWNRQHLGTQDLYVVASLSLAKKMMPSSKLKINRAANFNS